MDMESLRNQTQPIPALPSIPARHGCASAAQPPGLGGTVARSAALNVPIGKAIGSNERLEGLKIALRLLELEDCGSRYLGWLNDPEIKRYLETRWKPQTAPALVEFVHEMRDSYSNYLFAILDKPGGSHIGNIKVGPICPNHGFGEIGFFVGDRSQWGKGMATEAIRLVCRFAFDRLGLHRVFAGVYGSNLGSRKALEKAGFSLEGNFRGELITEEGTREDHLWYGLLASESLPSRPD